MELFSRHGFDGVSARAIERSAGLERGLVAYHFRSKENLWKEVVSRLFESLFAELSVLQNALRDVSRRERARAMLLAYARFNIRRPEFFRILVLEGHTRNDRSRYLSERLEEGSEYFRSILDRQDEITPEEMMWQFLVMGSSGVLFAATAYLEPDMEDRVRSPDAQEMFAQSIAATLFGAPAYLTQDD